MWRGWRRAQAVFNVMQDEGHPGSARSLTEKLGSVIVRESRKRDWLIPGEVANRRCDQRGLTAAVLFVVFHNSLGLPRGKTKTKEPFPEGLERDVDVLNGLS